jgi:PAS domain S-box-containing protein
MQIINNNNLCFLYFFRVFLATARDVTAQRAASAYARSLIEASLDPLVTINPAGEITDVNTAAENVTGVPRSKLIGSDFAIYYTEPEKAREAYRTAFKNGQVTNYPLSIRDLDGRITYVMYNASVYKDEDGKVQGVLATARDVTAQRAASAYARSLIEASLDPLVTINPAGEITDVNTAAENVTGVPRSKLIGSDFAIYYTEPEKAREAYRTAFKNGQVTNYPLSIRDLDGRITYVMYNASVYKDEDGKVQGVLGKKKTKYTIIRNNNIYTENENFSFQSLQINSYNTNLIYI